jgi:hypothetical protein
LLQEEEHATKVERERRRGTAGRYPNCTVVGKLWAHAQKSISLFGAERRMGEGKG